jgi:hypothetical protein
MEKSKFKWEMLRGKTLKTVRWNEKDKKRNTKKGEKDKWSILSHLFLVFKNKTELFILISHQSSSTGNTNWRGKLSTVDSPIKVTCFVKR